MALRFCVGEGRGVRVIVGVTLGSSVRVGDRVGVEEACVVEVTKAGSAVAWPDGSVWFCLNVGERTGVAVRC